MIKKYYIKKYNYFDYQLTELNYIDALYLPEHKSFAWSTGRGWKLQLQDSLAS